MRCAYQAPEHEFRQGRELICPKCRAYLEHFSVDYDRPGFVSTFHACGHFSSETSVGLVCLDCNAESDAAETGSRTVYRYDLSEAGHEYLRNGASLPDPSSQASVVVHRLLTFAAQYFDGNTNCSVLVIKLDLPKSKSASRAWHQSHALYASLLSEVFTMETEIIELSPWYFVLLANDKKAEVEPALPAIKKAIEQHLTAPPNARYSVFTPQEILSIFGRSKSSS